MKTILSTCKKYKLIIDKATFKRKGFYWAFRSGIIIELSTFKIFSHNVFEIEDKLVGNKNFISHHGQGVNSDYYRVEIGENSGFIVDSKGFPQNVLDMKIENVRYDVIEFKIPKP